MQKIKVSRFEYVFVQAAAKDGLLDIEEYEQFTEEEELQQRKENVKKQLERILTANRAK